MTEIVPGNGLLARECADEVMFILKAGQPYIPNDRVVFIRKMLMLLRDSDHLKSTLFAIFREGLDGICQRIDDIVKIWMREDPNQKLRTVRTLQVFVDAIIEAYEAKYLEFYGVQLRPTMLSMTLGDRENILQLSLEFNCEVLKDAIITLGPDGITLNGACQTAGKRQSLKRQRSN